MVGLICLLFGPESQGTQPHHFCYCIFALKKAQIVLDQEFRLLAAFIFGYYDVIADFLLPLLGYCMQIQLLHF